jgi:cyclopropane fatty-acyl-phospholipid synthase-like methyltransferase
MNRETEEKLAKALTAETTELIPFLPYLLQDLWELGSNPRDMLRLIKKHMSISKDTAFLELACGKGACAINIAKELGVKVHGFDLLPDFIAYAKQKAEEWGVDSLCRFTVGDVNEIVNTEKDYDCAIFGAAGDVLGNPQETLSKLSQTIKSGGYIIMDATYLPDDGNVENLQWAYEYLKCEDWLRLFHENGLRLAEELPDEEGHDFDGEMDVMVMRVNELIAKYPDKRDMFEGYLKSQQSEIADLENALVEGTWILQKNEDFEA